MDLASHSAEESRIRLKNARLLFLAQPFSVGGALPFVFLLGLIQSAQLAIPIGLECIDN